MKAPSALLALLAAGPLACIESPAAPTEEPARTSRPTAPRFDDRFWRELIFNEHDAPGQGDFVRVLSNPSPSVYVRLGNAGGTRRVVADDRLDHIREVLPLLAEQITGRPYDGRIESGIEERGDRDGDDQATHLKAPRTAASLLKKGLFRAVSGGPEARRCR